MSIKGHHTVTVVITLVLLSVRHGVIVTVIDNLKTLIVVIDSQVIVMYNLNFEVHVIHVD